jgi:hypothetical protein
VPRSLRSVAGAPKYDAQEKASHFGRDDSFEYVSETELKKLPHHAGQKIRGTDSEVEDGAGGDARLVLGVGVEASDEVVDLDGSNPDVRN